MTVRSPGAGGPGEALVETLRTWGPAVAVMAAIFALSSRPSLPVPPGYDDKVAHAVAYGTLARRDRARAHADVANWIESAAGARQREFADLLAHHLGLAYEGALADPESSEDRREELRRRSLEAALAASADA